MKYDNFFDDIAGDVIEDIQKEEVGIFVETDKTVMLSFSYVFDIPVGVNNIERKANNLRLTWEFIKELHRLSDLDIKSINFDKYSSYGFEIKVSLTDISSMNINDIILIIKDIARISNNESLKSTSVEHINQSRIAHISGSMFPKSNTLNRIKDTLSIYKGFQILSGQLNASTIFKKMYGDYLEFMIIRDYLATKNATYKVSPYVIPIEQVNKLIGYAPGVWISGIIFRSPNRSPSMFDYNKDKMIADGRYHIIDVYRRPVIEISTSKIYVFVIYNMINSNTDETLGCPFNKIEIPMEVDIQNNCANYIISCLNLMYQNGHQT
jgi:hypothetical protein